MKALLLFVPLALLGQTAGDPFTLVKIITRPIADASASEVYSATHAPIDVLGVRSITGATQVWHIEAHGSFASIEALDKAAGGRELAGTAMIGIYRPGLSYRPDEAIRVLPAAHYLQVSVYRIRPGSEIDFVELMKIRRSAFDSINLDRPEIGYQVISGSLSGTYIFVAPLQSLRMIDNALSKMPVYGEATVHAGSKTGREIATAAEVTREALIFRVDPRISYVSEAFTAADPDFWKH